MIQSHLPVYIIPDGPGGDMGIIRNMFSDPFFNVTFLQSDEPISTGRGEIIEKQLVMRALNDGRSNYPNSPIFIVKDTSISSSSSGDIAQIIKTAISNSQSNPSNEFHAFYTCVWLDRCELYTGKKQISDNGAFTAFTDSPHGLQAVLFSPSGRDIILGHEYMDNGKLFDINSTSSLGEAINRETFLRNLRVACVYPNIIDYNISASQSTDDLLKAQRCLPIHTNKLGGTKWKKRSRESGEAGKTSLTLVLIIVIIIILIALILLLVRNSVR